MTLVDLSFAALFATPAGYAVTGQYDGLDLVNGGKHRAVDVGNRGMDDPILSPVDGLGMGMRHTDGALGVDYDIGGGWHVQLWHLNATLAPLGEWVPIVRRQVCGRTGNTGALVGGRPMPAHTHVELEREGVRFDIEPYLRGRLFETGVGDVEIPADTRRIANRVAVVQGSVHAGVRVRSAPVTGAVLVELEARDYPYMCIGTVLRNGAYWMLGYLHPHGEGKPPIVGWFASAFSTQPVPDQEAVLR